MNGSITVAIRVCLNRVKAILLCKMEHKGRIPSCLGQYNIKINLSISKRLPGKNRSRVTKHNHSLCSDSAKYSRLRLIRGRAASFRLSIPGRK